MPLVFLFPGQHSYYPEILDRLRRSSSLAQNILNEASDILGRSLRGNAALAPESSAGRDAHVSVFLANYVLTRWLEVEGFPADYSAGFSLGEYNHLVEIGVLSFEDALKIADARGLCYERGPAGNMLRVQCSEPDLLKALLHASAVGFVDTAAKLAREQFVIAGDPGAVRAAADWLALNTGAGIEAFDSFRPMHVGMFRQACDLFRPVLEQARWQAPGADYLSNSEGRFSDPPSARHFIDLMFQQTFSTVQWSRCLEALLTRYPMSVVLEVGPKSMLSDIMARDFPASICLRTDDSNSHGSFLAALEGLIKRLSVA